MEPEVGVEYSLQLGTSLLGRGEQGAGSDEFVSLRYDFKPASACRATTGQMDVQLASQKVSLQMGDAAFAGKYEASRDGLDCIAVFDGTSFHLELLGATVKNLRHIAGERRAAAPARGATPQPPGQPAAPAAGAPAAHAAVAPGAATADGEADGLDPGFSTLLEDELLRALAEDEEPEAAAEGTAEADDMEVDAGAEADAAASCEAGPAAATDEEISSEDDEGEEGEEEEEEDDDDEEEGGGPEAQQQPVGGGAAQPAAAHVPVLPGAPSMSREDMTDLDLMFFGYEAEGGSPEVPAQQGLAGGAAGGSSGGSSGDDGGGASEPEQEEI